MISLEQSLRNAEDEITSLKNTISDKDNLIANLRASNNSLYARVVELEQAWSNEKQISEEQKAYYDNEILRLNNLINDNNSEIANLLVEISELENYVILLESENSELNDNVVRYEKENTNLLGQVQNLTTQNSELSSSLDSITAERDYYQSLYEEYKNLYDNLVVEKEEECMFFLYAGSPYDTTSPNAEAKYSAAIVEDGNNAKVFVSMRDAVASNFYDFVCVPEGNVYSGESDKYVYTLTVADDSSYVSITLYNKEAGKTVYDNKKAGKFNLPEEMEGYKTSFNHTYYNGQYGSPAGVGTATRSINLDYLRGVGYYEDSLKNIYVDFYINVESDGAITFDFMPNEKIVSIDFSFSADLFGTIPEIDTVSISYADSTSDTCSFISTWFAAYQYEV